MCVLFGVLGSIVMRVCLSLLLLRVCLVLLCGVLGPVICFVCLCVCCVVCVLLWFGCLLVCVVVWCVRSLYAMCFVVCCYELRVHVLVVWSARSYSCFVCLGVCVCLCCCCVWRCLLLFGVLVMCVFVCVVVMCCAALVDVTCFLFVLVWCVRSGCVVAVVFWFVLCVDLLTRECFVCWCCLVC